MTGLRWYNIVFYEDPLEVIPKPQIRYLNTMPHLEKRNSPYLIALPIIIACLIFFSACLNDSPRRIPPRAVKGVLDLSDWDLKNDGPVDLIGEYEFYWMQHLLPEDFPKTTPREKTEFIKVPGYWNGHKLGGKELPGHGYATYRLNVILEKQEESLALRTVEISNAYTIYVNGQRVGSMGIPGNSLETTVPRQFPQILDFAHKKKIKWRLLFMFQIFTTGAAESGKFFNWEEKRICAKLRRAG